MNSEVTNSNSRSNDHANLFVSRLLNALARTASNETKPTALSVAQSWKAAFAQLDGGFCNVKR